MCAADALFLCGSGASCMLTAGHFCRPKWFFWLIDWLNSRHALSVCHALILYHKKAVLSHGEPRDAAVNFDRLLQRHIATRAYAAMHLLAHCTARLVVTCRPYTSATTLVSKTSLNYASFTGWWLFDVLIFFQVLTTKVEFFGWLIAMLCALFSITEG